MDLHGSGRRNSRSSARRLGLGMWADWIDEPNLSPEQLAAPGESFIVFRPGYCEQERARMVAAGLISP